ncbi:MAG: hypothetical protein ACYC2G_14605 [Gemmatimonadaceae bacterium]
MNSRVSIRPLVSPADYAACLALQHETWGPDFGEAVPPAILKVAQRLGGVAAGAFDAGGRLLGFVFGLTGVERGRVVHWSDMLAVRPELRDAGLGRRLKEWQREAARAVGATVMYWTFDPLVARNAHLNFNRLGTRAHEYVRDMYGDATSALHRGIGTDRLIVAWPLDGPPHGSACPGGTVAELPAALRDAPLMDAAEDFAAGNIPPDGSGVDGPDAGGVGAAGGAVPPAPPAVVRITIPLDIHAVVAAGPEDAAAWRRRTRAAWERALGQGYEVVGFCREPDTDVGNYVLARTGRR